MSPVSSANPVAATCVEICHACMLAMHACMHAESGMPQCSSPVSVCLASQRHTPVLPLHLDALGSVCCTAHVRIANASSSRLQRPGLQCLQKLVTAHAVGAHASRQPARSAQSAAHSISNQILQLAQLLRTPCLPLRLRQDHPNVVRLLQQRVDSNS